MIKAQDVSFQYPDGTVALKHINLDIGPGELVFITGPSGSGKTTLLKLFLGMEFPSSGSLTVLGREMTRRHEASLRKLRTAIGPVFQDFRLVKGRTCLENVMMGLRFLPLSPAEMKANAKAALEKVGLAHKALSPVDNLSWGESQRVSIARAIARKPALILADEPTGNLDRENAQSILGLLQSLRDENATVLVTTHATHLIEDLFPSRLVELKNGTIVEDRVRQ